jgi:hypothetical protein
MSIKLVFELIRDDGGTQPRAQPDDNVISEYAEAMAEGAVFPPVTVFYDGSSYWLADGFHRAHAAMMIGREDIEADVRQGSQRDAILYSVGANSSHGLRRTNDDKRRSVLRLLEDEEWGKWSDGSIAEKCSVSQPFVSKMRRERTQNGFESSSTKTGKDGRTTNTGNVGRKPKSTSRKGPDDRPGTADSEAHDRSEAREEESSEARAKRREESIRKYASKLGRDIWPAVMDPAKECYPELNTTDGLALFSISFMDSLLNSLGEGIERDSVITLIFKYYKNVQYEILRGEDRAA